MDDAWGFKDKENAKKKGKEVELIEDYNKLKATFDEQIRMANKDRDVTDNILEPLIYDLMGDANDDTQLGLIGDLRHALRNSRIGKIPIGTNMKKAIELIESINNTQVRYYEQLEAYIDGFKHLMKSSFGIVDKKNEELRKLRGYLANREEKVKPTKIQKQSREKIRDEVIKMLSEGVTQDEISKALGIHQTNVSYIKRNYYDIQQPESIINKEENVINKEEKDIEKKFVKEFGDSSQLTQNLDSQNTLNNTENPENDEEEDEDDEEINDGK